MKRLRPEAIILSLLTVILLLSGYMAYKWHDVEVRESFEEGVREGGERVREDMKNQIDSQGYVSVNFRVEGRTVTYTLVRAGSIDSIRQGVSESYDRGYLQGFSEGRSQLATDMLSQLKTRGFIKYNFTDGKNMLPVVLTPGMIENE